MCRSGTGTEFKAPQACCASSQQKPQPQPTVKGCCSDHNHRHGHADNESAGGEAEKATAGGTAAAAPVYTFRKDESDVIGKRLDDWTSKERIKTIVAAVSERAAKVYNNVVAKGIKGKL